MCDHKPTGGGGGILASGGGELLLHHIQALQDVPFLCVMSINVDPLAKVSLTQCDIRAGYISMYNQSYVVM